MRARILKRLTPCVLCLMLAAPGALQAQASAPKFTDVTREAGVYEVERNRLYLVSVGSELYIVWIERPAVRINYEREIHDLLVSH